MLREFFRDYKKESYVLNNDKVGICQLLLFTFIISVFVFCIFLLGYYTSTINIFVIILSLILVIVFFEYQILNIFPKKSKRKYILHPLKMLKTYGYMSYRKERIIVLNILEHHQLNQNDKEIDGIIEYLKNENINNKKKKMSPTDFYTLVITIISMCLSIASLLKWNNMSNTLIISYILMVIIMIVVIICFIRGIVSNIHFYKSIINKSIDYELLIDIMTDIKLNYYKNKH